MSSRTLGSSILFRATLFAFLTKLFTSQKSPSLYFAQVNHFVIDHFLSGKKQMNATVAIQHLFVAVTS
jgi:hypothetical protein